MRASQPDDAALVLSARSGDPASLSALFERHRARLLAAAVERLGPGPQVEDAVQETFVIVLCHLDQLRDPAAVGPWLLAILRNVCRAQLCRPAVELIRDPGRLGGVAEGRSVEEAIDRPPCATGCGRRWTGCPSRCGWWSGFATSSAPAPTGPSPTSARSRSARCGAASTPPVPGSPGSCWRRRPRPTSRWRHTGSWRRSGSR